MKDDFAQDPQQQEPEDAAQAGEELIQEEMVSSPLGDLKSQYKQLTLEGGDKSAPSKPTDEKKKTPPEEKTVVAEKQPQPQFQPPQQPQEVRRQPDAVPEQIAQRRADRVNTFSLRIEEDTSNMLPQAKRGEGLGNAVYSTLQHIDHTAAQVSASNAKRPVDQEAKRAQERAFYEMQNKLNHPEKEPVKVRHHKRVAKKRKIKSKGGCLSKMIIALSIVICATFLSYFCMSCANDLLGLFKQDNPVIVKVPQNASTEDIAKLLSEHQLIDQPVFFQIFSKLRKYDGKYNSGTFELNPKSGYEGMIGEMQRVFEDFAESVRVTFPEGYTLEKMADLLEKKGVCKKELFFSALEEGDFSNYSFVREIGEVEGRFYKLEGYLFPDTYDFFLNETPESVIKKFLDNFDVKFSQELRNTALAQGKTIDQVLTLASLIQKEAVDPEMGRVSSVFNNRLNNPGVYPKLESDVTIFYAQQVIQVALEKQGRGGEYQFYYDHYSTYRCNGLPAGPICNPGEKAILAALEPEHTPYYFFVTDTKGKNQFFYAETMSEHEKNIKLADAVE